ncbi:MAG: hypothetical protein QME42_08655, partial [bacterium]|nr:hypothetical protein [bacterium]
MKVLFSETGLQFNKFLNPQIQGELVENALIQQAHLKKGSFGSHLIHQACLAGTIKENLIPGESATNQASLEKTQNNFFFRFPEGNNQTNLLPTPINQIAEMPFSTNQTSKIHITSIEQLPQKVIEKFIGLKKDVPQLIVTEIIDHPNSLFGNPKPIFSTPDVNLKTIEKNPAIKEMEESIKVKGQPVGVKGNPDVEIDVPKGSPVGMKGNPDVEVSEPKGQPVGVKGNPEVEVSEPKGQPVGVKGNPE